jgi:hypothetical protein
MGPRCGVSDQQRCPLIPVLLQVELLENTRRLRSAERSNKLRDPVILEGYLSIDSIQQPDVPERAATGRYRAQS